MDMFSKLKNLIVPSHPTEDFKNAKNMILLQNMTLVEYLEACHVVFAKALGPKPDITSCDVYPSEHGPHCDWVPTEIREWPTFDEQQDAVLAKVHAAIPADLRAFESLAFLRGLARRHLGNIFESNEATKRKALDAIHAPVTCILGQIGTQNIPAIKSLEGFTYCYEPARSHSVVDLETGTRQVSYFAERRLMWNCSGDVSKSVLVTQYMSPDGVADTAIPEVFRAMVDLKVEYGQIITGESIVFLRIDWDEPTVLYRHTATPKTDIDGSLRENLNRTAVSQELAFILRVAGAT